MTREVCFIDKEGQIATCGGTVVNGKVDDTIIDCSKCGFRKQYNGNEAEYFSYTCWTGEIKE